MNLYDRITAAVLACSDDMAIAAPWAEECPYQCCDLSIEALAHLIGQGAHETGGYRYFEERLSGYTAKRLREVFSVYRNDPGLADIHAGDAVAIGNTAYAWRNGNGPPESGDGWRFIGRGVIPITGRANYKRAAGWVGQDLEENPELAAEPATAWIVAHDWMLNIRVSQRPLAEWARAGNAAAVTRGIKSDRLPPVEKYPDWVGFPVLGVSPLCREHDQLGLGLLLLPDLCGY